MHQSAADHRQIPAGHAVTVTVSTLCATALAAAGTPVADALLLVAGAGAAGALSGRLGSAKPVREVIRNLLNSPS
ncbi:hypothetical protein OG239_00620 [Streptomyces sp. NBC_00868]|uniref:hypothetical protein n=1 Tax=unclassified Streptomyces TaxID=2593676 RepID=UPI003247066C|nr:hypothetical protein OG239_00620 [Streptomyces sp. NBC_00868]